MVERAAIAANLGIKADAQMLSSNYRGWRQIIRSLGSRANTQRFQWCHCLLQLLGLYNCRAFLERQKHPIDPFLN
jgi:hypothetical protein